MNCLVLLICFLCLQIMYAQSYSTQPMNCTDTTRLCTSFLAFKPQQNLNLAVIQSMFDVLPQDVTVEGNDHGYIFIKKNCSCLSTAKVYATNTTYTVKSSEGYVYDIVINAYDGLAFLPNITRRAKVGAVISLRLFCGCSSGLWNYLMSYVMSEEDTVESLSSRFGVSMDSIEAVNGIGNPDNVTVGALYYVPLNSVPGEPYPLENDIPPSPTPVPEPSFESFSANQQKHKARVPYEWIIGSLGIGIALIVFCIVFCVCLKSSTCFSKDQGDHAKDPDGEISHKFHILRKPSFCCASGRFISDKSGDWKQTNGETSSHHRAIPRVLETDIINMEKPVIFTYEEIISASDGFSDSSLIGHGTYGSVYYGHLRDQEVAVKRMTATKTKEFMAEMKILCKVHHTNLVELIGYAASDEELFLIYEYAQKGSLKSHLHDPQNKGHTSLSWNIRVQIALDAARGLEYIHEHTKTHYVHRDIKTSNILLDGSFRAKISDFGLAKLVGKRGDGETTATKVVGTFGYLAPEYLSDGLATAKSDVYAFGVVLFEIISGREAIIHTEGSATKNPERRSLASVMLTALRNSPDSVSMSSLKDHIDPNMMNLYPHDCVFKIDELVAQAFKMEVTSKQGRREIESFSHVLSDMFSSLKPWVPRFQKALSNPSAGSKNQLGWSSAEKTVSSVNEDENFEVESPDQTRINSLISPSPLVSWRAECNIDRGRQLFLLTPLPMSKTLSFKRQDLSKSVSERIASNPAVELPSFLEISGYVNDDLLEGIATKPTPNKPSDLLVTKAKTTRNSESISSPNFSRSDHSALLKSPCLKMSPPKSCVLLEPISETSHKSKAIARKSTPFPAGIHSQISESSSESEDSEDLAMKYPELLGIQRACISRMGKKDLETSPSWFFSPPKTCVLLEPPDEKPLASSVTYLPEKASILNQKTVLILSKECNDQDGCLEVDKSFNEGGNLTLIESTPIWKEPESTMRMGKRPGENTLKKELWTKFEAASTCGIRLNVSALQKTARKGFLDMLDDVSFDVETTVDDGLR